MADPVTEYLDPGEVLRGTYHPSFRVYLRREVFVVTLTALAFAPVIFFLGDPRAWIILPLVVLVDLFIFDNLGDWRRNSALMWLLTDQRLLQVDRSDPLEFRALPIAQIARLRGILLWRLFVVGEGREIIDIAYVPDLRGLRAALTDAREAVA
jgi:hypothetical protein